MGADRTRIPLGLLLIASALGGWIGLHEAAAADRENCLGCHRFRGLSRIEPDTGNLRLFFCSDEYYFEHQGPHAQLACTACHLSSEVQTVPHEVRTPVDCNSQCHVVPLAGVEIPFSHQSVSERLESSAHGSAALANLPFNPPLLGPGQSSCLYCHDEPLFHEPVGRFAGLRWMGDNSRCDTCHGEELPVQVAYHIRHVTSRLQPARPVRQLVQVCAVCHSNSEVIARTGGHDVVASYLHSFHGKASLLGSTATAQCVDCHASETGDVHGMLGHEQAASSVNPQRVQNTCRTTQCHSGAPPDMSQAAVHLDLDPQARTPEFYVAAMFIIMTAAVMTLFFIFILLELFNAAVRRHDPEHERLVRLARKIQDSPEGRALVERLSFHERFQHWLLAVTFILLVLTGMPIKFAEAELSSRIITAVGGLPVARALHRISAVLMIASFIYHIGYLAYRFVGSVRRQRAAGSKRNVLQMLLDAGPMLTLQDVKDFVALFAYLLFLRKERPRFGHFNFMQKFEYWAVFWGIPVMGLSGLALWGAAGLSELVPGRVLNFAFIIHSDEAYLAAIYIAVVHMFSIILAPVVFPLSPATLTGQAPAAELAEAHRGQIEDVAARLGISVEPEPPGRWTVSDWAGEGIKRLYSLGLASACAAIGFVSIRFLLTLLLTRQAAPVEITDIPIRLTTAMLTASAPADARHEEGDHRPRGPLAHFHQIPAWFQPDTGGDCTTSGCHNALPHAERIEVRAFLNMHATFVDCMVCHGGAATPPGQASWHTLADRQSVGVPATLQLIGWFESHADLKSVDATAVGQQVRQLLLQASEQASGNARLQRWALAIETAYPGSEAWHAAMHEVRQGLALYKHGEYGAKIAVPGGFGRLSPEQRRASDEYLAGDRLSVEARKAVLKRVHQGVAPRGAMCAPCHSAEPALVDLTALGYPESRIKDLRGSQIVSQVLSIEQGQPFHLPISGGSDGR